MFSSDVVIGRIGNSNTLAGMSLYALKFALEAAIRFSGFGKNDHIPIKRVITEYKREHEGQFPATPTNIAAHEMGHVVVAFEKKMRVKFATISRRTQGRIQGPQVSIEKAEPSDLHLLYAAGVAGLIVGINMDNGLSVESLNEGLYQTAQWGSIKDFTKYKKQKKMMGGFNVESYFASSVLECIKIIGSKQEFFERGRISLVQNEYHCGHNLLLISENKEIVKSMDEESLKDISNRNRFKYKWTNIDDPDKTYMD